MSLSLKFRFKQALRVKIEPEPPQTTTISHLFTHFCVYTVSDFIKKFTKNDNKFPANWQNDFFWCIYRTTVRECWKNRSINNSCMQKTRKNLNQVNSQSLLECYKIQNVCKNWQKSFIWLSKNHFLKCSIR